MNAAANPPAPFLPTSSTTISGGPTTTTPPFITAPPAPILTPASIATAAVSSRSVHSRIRSLQFVNCTVQPQYLLTMIQYSLPSLTALHLTQSWQGQPLHTGFLDSLSKICPGLRELTLHATQSHRGVVTSGDMLRLLQGLEASPTTTTIIGEQGGTDMLEFADFPLETFRGYGTPSSISSSSTMDQGQKSQDHDDGLDLLSSSPRPASALESISVWFTHSILDEAIIDELADKNRHPNLKRVDFGSESSFDPGEELMHSLRQLRPELTVCVWVGHEDTGKDRED
ncbi:hypothetical protein BGZ65_003851 [Modicella reniformis]|uniref:Uncharacterized protein n=1 Tax=Modicella reniformis TaxID=1440133 RepID=A0A9P6MHS7_9FUNG|nr:hypothetical protein BGZ65_003851 [Modicella reniformis]